MNILEEINFLVDRDFGPVWEACDREAAFELCNQIRLDTDVPPYSERKFDEGWQYRVIFHEDFEIAKDEFVNLVFGWW